YADEVFARAPTYDARDAVAHLSVVLRVHRDEALVAHALEPSGVAHEMEASSVERGAHLRSFGVASHTPHRRAGPALVDLEVTAATALRARIVLALDVAGHGARRALARVRRLRDGARASASRASKRGDEGDTP